jgi:hypothetical protein
MYTKIRSERVTFFTGWRSEFDRRLSSSLFCVRGENTWCPWLDLSMTFQCPKCGVDSRARAPGRRQSGNSAIAGPNRPASSQPRLAALAMPGVGGMAGAVPPRCGTPSAARIAPRRATRCGCSLTQNSWILALSQGVGLKKYLY